MAKSKISFRKRTPTGRWLFLGLAICSVLFLVGGATFDQPNTGLSSVAMIGAFVAVCVGPVLLALTLLWGSFTLLRWVWTG
ncbi:hypothetical protein B7G68_14290 [Caulobacter segnis]|uniref:Uncharacterized protein n=2 Tax=Caulobacter segnis TaxID=88688 RepID=D5VL68_CAUST|nr:hypothetical protein [Caulobacter segnis]ADG11241.1 conserved hypothetical protein [Caulobacter segnis ATCC 21756]AVQ02919.1 hypothetical protein B7G68_14290 [Caulobacter segnis]